MIFIFGPFILLCWLIGATIYALAYAAVMIAWALAVCTAWVVLKFVQLAMPSYRAGSGSVNTLEAQPSIQVSRLDILREHLRLPGSPAVPVNQRRSRRGRGTPGFLPMGVPVAVAERGKEEAYCREHGAAPPFDNRERREAKAREAKREEARRMSLFDAAGSHHIPPQDGLVQDGAQKSAPGVRRKRAEALLRATAAGGQGPAARDARAMLGSSGLQTREREGARDDDDA